MSQQTYNTPALVKQDSVVGATLGQTNFDLEPVSPPRDKRI